MKEEYVIMGRKSNGEKRVILRTHKRPVAEEFVRNINTYKRNGYVAIWWSQTIWRENDEGY